MAVVGALSTALTCFPVDLRILVKSGGLLSSSEHCVERAFFFLLFPLLVGYLRLSRLLPPSTKALPDASLSWSD